MFLQLLISKFPRSMLVAEHCCSGGLVGRHLFCYMRLVRMTLAEISCSKVSYQQRLLSLELAAYYGTACGMCSGWDVAGATIAGCSQ